MKILLIIMFFVNTYSAMASVSGFLKKYLPLQLMRPVILAHGWVPLANPNPEKLIGLEKKIYLAGYREIYGCAMDFPLCILQYKNKRGQCLSVFVHGDKFEHLEVIDWNEACQ